MVVVVSKALFTSKNCNDEIRAAIENDLKIVPLLFEPDAVNENDGWERTIAEYERKGDEKSLREVEEIKKARKVGGVCE